MIVRVARKPKRKRIVILGGGFGGVYAAIDLEKLMARERTAEVCLVSRDNFFLFTPMLHEIAASDLEITNIVNPLRKLLRKVEVLVGNVNQVDLRNQRVLISRGYRNRPQQICYDHLVIALGSITNIHNHPGFSELALTMKALPDAIRLRAQILRRLEDANSESDPIDRQSLLTFVVAGGGFAGVETVAAVNDFVREALPFYPNLGEKMLRVILVHSGPVILPELGESLGRYTEKVLARRGVEVRLNTRVKSMTESEVLLPPWCLNSVAHFGVDCWNRAQSHHLFAPLRKGTRPITGKPILASHRLAQRLGGGGLCICAGQQKSREISSAYSATCDTRGRSCGVEYRGCPFRSSFKIIFIQNHWAAGFDRSSDGRGADFRFQFLGLLYVVDVADSLSQQIARLG